MSMTESQSLTDLQSKIIEWHAWMVREREQLHFRENKQRLTVDLGLALLGVRRCGKTSQALMLMSEHQVTRTIYMNFEDPVFHNQDWKVLDLLLEQYVQIHKQEPELVIFDEIQNIANWEKWVRKFIDQKKAKLIVTGSSAKMLSSELATALSGRALKIEIWPLSFQEILKFKNKKNLKIPDLLLAEFEDFIMLGGFPYPRLHLEGMERTELLRQYFVDIVYRDIMSRHQIRTKAQLDQIINHYFVNLSCHHSYSSLKKAYGIPTETGAAYTQYLQDAYLIFEVNRYHGNLKVQARDSKKIYVIDTGLRNANCYSQTPDHGKLLENQVYIELRRRKKQVYYFKEKSEVDFVLCENRKAVDLIQVSDSNLEDENTFTREMFGLEEAMSQLKIKKGTLLTKKRRESIKTSAGVVQLLPAYEWFLTSPSHE